MTKIDIVTDLYEKLGFSKRECAHIVDRFFEIIKDTLATDENVKISGFGNFITREKRARKGRNPQTGEEIIICGRRVMTFKPSAMLRKVVNQENQIAEEIEVQ